MNYPTSQPAKSRAGPVFAGQVTFKDVSYATRGKTILHNINLTVEAGQIACLLGPSGCGKTTLLRLAAGLIAPTAGRIMLDQFEIAGALRFVPPEQRNIGLVFQDFALFPHMTAQENVAYGLYALERREAMRVAALALERVGLGRVTTHYPATLSGGEQQRVALARALAPRPQVLLLDEPFSGLDQRLKDTVRDDTLALLRETRATALLVTHDPEEALALADKIHVMQAGEVAQSGTPDDLIHRPATRDVARFFSNYNSFMGVVHNNAVQLPVGKVKANGIAEGTAVEVLAAPHGFHIVDESRGAAATIVENRDLGGRRRVLARLHATDQLVLVHSSVNAISAESGTIGLALTGQDTHIFPIRRLAGS